MGRQKVGRRTQVALVAALIASVLVGQADAAGSSVVPTISATPSRNLADGALVTVIATNLTPGAASVAWCDGPAPEPRRCSVGQAVTVAADGSLTTTVKVRTALVDDSGKAFSCDEVCWVDVRRDATTLDAPVSIGAARILGEAAEPLDAEAFAWYRVVGFPGREAQVAQCVLPLGPTLATSSCGAAQHLSLDSSGSVESVGQWVNAKLDTTAGEQVDCRTVPCATAGFTIEGASVASAELHFRQATGISLAPAAGLVDGNPIAVNVAGLPVGAEVALAHCTSGSAAASSRCEQPFSDRHTADASGEVTATVPARQRLTTGGAYRYCRGSCTVAAVAADGTVVAEATYRMAVPFLAGSSTTGLADRSEIVVAGLGLQPDYAGPTLLLPTGRWSLVQCDAAIGQQPTLFTVLVGCGAVGGAGLPPVTASYAVTTAVVRTTVTRFLGGTTDCTVRSGACVLALVRWEQDATVSSAILPLSFG